MSFTSSSSLLSADPWNLLDKFSSTNGSIHSTSSIRSSTSISMSENLDEETIESMLEVADELSCKITDVPELLDEDNFRRLKASLRSRGCVTNAYLQQNMHKYVQHVRSKKAARSQRSHSDAARLSNAAA